MCARLVGRLRVCIEPLAIHHVSYRRADRTVDRRGREYAVNTRELERQELAQMITRSEAQAKKGVFLSACVVRRRQ